MRYLEERGFIECITAFLHDAIELLRARPRAAEEVRVQLHCD